MRKALQRYLDNNGLRKIVSMRQKKDYRTKSYIDLAGQRAAVVDSKGKAMSMTCPTCGAWTRTLETRTLKSGNVVTRRYECANTHGFTTEERIKDELLRRIQTGTRVLMPGQG